MDSQLSLLGIHYERFPAVDGASLSADFIAKFAPEKSWIGKRRPHDAFRRFLLSNEENAASQRALQLVAGHRYVGPACKGA
jgi:hypothetical protein